MSFEHAPVSKGLILACAAASLAVGVVDKKHYLHLQLIPHISRHHQYWRLFVHHLAYANSSELLVAELLFYNVGVQIERQFGSVKFASFALISVLISTILEFLALLLFYRAGFNYIPSGPTTLVFAIFYQYYRLVPATYQFRIFGLPLTNKVYAYILGLQLAITQPPSSVAVAALGILTGAIYRSDIANFKAYRLPPSVVVGFAKYLLPLLGPSPVSRRTNRAFPDTARRSDGPVAPATAEPEPVTTTTGARENANGRTAISPAPENTPSAAEPTTEPDTGTSRSSIMREWVDELTGRSQRAVTGLRVPSDTEIMQVASMFPDLDRQVVVTALQRSANAERAVEMLLTTQTS